VENKNRRLLDANEESTSGWLRTNTSTLRPFVGGISISQSRSFPLIARIAKQAQKYNQGQSVRPQSWMKI
jgi:hypothetical protein